MNVLCQMIIRLVTLVLLKISKKEYKLIAKAGDF